MSTKLIYFQNKYCIFALINSEKRQTVIINIIMIRDHGFDVVFIKNIAPLKFCLQYKNTRLDFTTIYRVYLVVVLIHIVCTTVLVASFVLVVKERNPGETYHHDK